MSSVMRPWRVLVRLAWVVARLEPRRTLIALLPWYAIGGGVGAVAGRALIDGRGEGAVGVAAPIVLGAAVFVQYVLAYWQAGAGMLRLSEVAGMEIDRMLMRQVSSTPSIALFDDPVLLDRLELLRVGRQPLASIVMLLQNLAAVGGFLAMTALLLATVDPRLALVPVVMVPVVWLFFRSERATMQAEARFAEGRREALHLFDVGTDPSAGKELRVFGLEAAVRARHSAAWGRVNAGLTRVNLRRAVVRGAAYTSAAIVVGATLLVFVRGADAALTAGDVFLVLMLLGQLTGLLGTAAATMMQARRAHTMAAHLDAVLALGSSTGGGVGPVGERLASGVELRGVTFHYPRVPQPALEGVDLVLAAGTSVAIVGENGAGKSTLVKLLCGHYQPSEGVVLVDGVPLDELDADGWSSRLAIVCQDFARFEFVVRESVGIGDLSALDDTTAVVDALRRADGDELVASLADGVATQLGARFGGQELSGGQWQRVAIARGFMRRAPLLLVLDEPTGALDAITEQHLLEGCISEARRLARERGTIVVFVSHRYSTVRRADEIVVMDRGRVAEHGSHDDLMARNGRYADLYRRQAEAYR